MGIFYLCRNFCFGKWFKVVVGIMYILIFIGIISLVLRDFSEKLKMIFLPQTPLIIIMLFFMVGAMYANKLGIASIVRANLFVSVLLFLGIFVMFFGVFKMMEVNRVFPIFGNGVTETFMVNSSNLYAFTGIGYLWFIKPMLKKKEEMNKIAFAGTLISAVYLFITILIFILILPTKIISDNSFSIYFISRMVNLGNFFARVESLFMFSWILTTLSYISISLFFALNIFKNIAKEKSDKSVKYIFGLIIIVLALVFSNFKQINFVSDIFKIVVVSVVFGLSFVILFLANIKQKRERAKLNEKNT